MPRQEIDGLWLKVYDYLWFMVHGSRFRVNDLLDGREEIKIRFRVQGHIRFMINGSGFMIQLWFMIHG